jgi:hypothetical protein
LSPFFEFFYFKRAQRVPVEKTSKFRPNAILSRAVGPYVSQSI